MVLALAIYLSRPELSHAKSSCRAGTSVVEHMVTKSMNLYCFLISQLDGAYSGKTLHVDLWYIDPMLFKNAPKSISLGVPIDGLYSETDLNGIARETGISLQEKTEKLVAQYPDRALKVIRSWMAVN